MYVKKSISLLLSGALLASLCTGCSQTTMEHHFFTDSVTETEINTEVVENAITPKIKELQEVLGDDLKLEVGVRSDGGISLSAPTGSQDELEAARKIYIQYIESSLNTKVSPETLANGIQNLLLGPIPIILCFSCGSPYDNEIKLSDLMRGTENAIEQLCGAFEELDTKSLEALKTKLKPGKNILTLQIFSYHHSENDQHYIVAVLALMPGGNVAWK